MFSIIGRFVTTAIELSFEQYDLLNWFKIYFGEYFKSIIQYEKQIMFRMFFFVDNDQWKVIETHQNEETIYMICEGVQIECQKYTDEFSMISTFLT